MNRLPGAASVRPGCCRGNYFWTRVQDERPTEHDRWRSTDDAVPDYTDEPGDSSRRGAGAEQGDVPGWVLVTLMTAGLVIALWAVAALL
ncbi:hypothetical protein NKG05_24050 [Oerskovia sp. M15]